MDLEDFSMPSDIPLPYKWLQTMTIAGLAAVGDSSIQAFSFVQPYTFFPLAIVTVSLHFIKGNCVSLHRIVPWAFGEKQSQ